MIQLLFAMKEMRNDEGNGAEITSREFRKSMMAMGMIPPAIDVTTKVEDRIGQRIELLINDGQQPAIAPSNGPIQGFEHHAAAKDMLLEVVLDVSFGMYSPQVQNALVAELEFHVQRLEGIHRAIDIFDQGIEAVDSRRQEIDLHMQETNADTASGMHMDLSELFG